MRLFLFSLLLVTNLLACANNSSTAPEQTLTGSDQDEHGCIASAGYVWCSYNNQCERPWELARQQNFANTEQAFSAYCNQSEY